ncbi:hypothetical protein HpHNI57_06900 [Helicobacter pylori]
MNATDIFKGELLKHAKEHEQEEFVSRWNALSQKCSDNDLKIETLFSWYLTYLNPVTSKEKMEKRLVTWFKNLNKTPLEYLKGVEDFYNAYCEVLEMQVDTPTCSLIKTMIIYALFCVPVCCTAIAKAR